MARWSLALLAGCAALLVGSASAQICPPQGAYLSVAPPSPVAIGTPLSVFLSGQPGAPYLIATDTAPGPVNLPPYGCIALGMSAGFRVILNGFETPFIRIPGTGEVQLDFFGVPNEPVLIGRTFYFQAAVGSSTPPGIALSNGAVLSIGQSPLRAYICDNPELYLFDGVRVLSLGSGCPTLFRDIPIGGFCHRLAAHPSSGALYVARRNAQDIAIVDMNTNLFTGLTIPSIPRPLHLAVNPSGTALFVLSRTDTGNWEVRRIAIANRLVTHTYLLGAMGIPIDAEFAEIIMEPTGGRLFVSRPGGISVFYVGTGDLTFLGTMFGEAGGIFRGLTFRPAELWACGPSGMWIADTTVPYTYFRDIRGNPTSEPAYPIQGGVRDVAYDPRTGQFYATNSTGETLFRFTPGVQAVERFDGILPAGVGHIGIDPSGTFLFASDGYGSNQPRILRLAGSIPTFVCDLGRVLFDPHEATGDIIFR